MRRSKAIRLRRMIEAAADKGLSDAEALEAIDLFAAWDAEAVYETGQRVRYEGGLYRCLMAHTAQDNWTPTAAPSLWARVLIPDEDVIPKWEQPESTNPYKKGDKVRHNGKIWVSILENNTWEPGFYGWEEVS
ncbi:MAG: hypothetical protein E7451_05700 [Ruminococcaceae bacterium]|nr:hypothetical protein [Oscillospiraceae bacterium]